MQGVINVICARGRGPKLKEVEAVFHKEWKKERPVSNAPPPTEGNGNSHILKQFDDASILRTVDVNFSDTGTLWGIVIELEDR